ncbi:hypothetical protein QBC45DRAFT_316662 [Copromyces sp. CBS 386.78]|nr:hypothetical protein QBC45DRAFT_316662 [Copromyces sp. CBS 386.78]
MGGPVPTLTISGVDNHTSPTSTNKPLSIPTSRHQTRPQTQASKQKQAQTTTGFIFHVSTLVYRPRTSTSTSSTSTSSSSSTNTGSGSGSISGYTSSGSDSTSNQNININSTKSTGKSNYHPDPLRQHQVKLLYPLLPRPSAGETIARLQAVGIPFVIVWEPSSSESSGSGLGYGDDGFDNEFTSEEEVANTLTRVLGLKVPICSEKVVGRWTLLRNVAAQGQQQSAKVGQDRKGSGEGGQEGSSMGKKEVTGTLVIGDDEARCREMARMLGFEAERVEKRGEKNVKEKEEKKQEGEEAQEKDQQKKPDLNLRQNQAQGHLQKPRLSLRNRLSCPFDEMKVVESLCFYPEDKIDEESNGDDDNASGKQPEFEKKKEEVKKDSRTDSPTSTTPPTPDTVQGQYIPVKHRERTVAYVPVSPTSSTSSKKGVESSVTRVTSVIFFSAPSAETWDRDVHVVSKLCQSQGVEAPKLYIVQKPGELRRGSLASSSASSSSSTSSTTPFPTFSTSPSESSLETLATTTSTVFSRASSASTTESAPSTKRPFKLTISRTTSDWIRDVTAHWRATNPNLPDKARLSYYLIDPLTCALQVLEIGRQRAQSTIWARANLPVHLRQVLGLETLYVVDSGEQPSGLFHDLNGAKGGGGYCSKAEHSPEASCDPDPESSFQRYLSSLGVDVIPAKRCRRLLMSDVYKVEKRVQELGYDVRKSYDDKPGELRDSRDQNPTKVHGAREGETCSSKAVSQTHQRRTSWFRQLITRGQPRSKARIPSGGQSQTQRPSTSTSSNNHHTKHTNHSNSSTTNLTINSTNIPNIPLTNTGTGGIPRSTTFPSITPNTVSNTTRYTSLPTATTAKFYSPSALQMVSRTPSQKTRDINAITAFCHSNNIETAVKYAVNREYWECVDAGLRPVWPTGDGGWSSGGDRI